MPDAERQELLASAHLLLEQNEPFASQDPEWYTAMLRVLRWQVTSDDELLLLHAEALQAHPLYDQTHFELFRYFVQRWYPNTKMIDAFANTVLAGTQDLEGNMAYALLYDDAARSLDQGKLLSGWGENWPIAKSGFEKINEQYPTIWNANQFGFHACMARDVSTARRLFAEFVGPPVREVWPSSMIYEQCKAWATQDASDEIPK